MSEQTEPIDVQVARAIGLTVEYWNQRYWIGTRMMPEYSTDTAAAMDALERFCEMREYDWELIRRGDRYLCELLGRQSKFPPSIACEYGTEIPAAICQAILEASKGKS